jgi:VWFA-related protein
MHAKVTRNIALLLLLVAVTLPALARRVTVSQLEQLIAFDHTLPDPELARQLVDLELTERVSDARLARLQDQCTGPTARQSLLVLAHLSAFLPLPAADIPPNPAPDLASQRSMLALTTSYVSRIIPQLPNFFATRVTTRWEDTPLSASGDLWQPVVYQPLHLVDSSRDTVLYRDGHEVVDPGVNVKGSSRKPAGLSTWGVFGPILSTVLVDAAQSQLAWSHWEQGPGGMLAVYGYSVPRNHSHYEVKSSIYDYVTFHQIVGYHGEIGVDPATGTILRLTVIAQMKSSDPISRADISVEYGTVQIGHRSYICPLRSLSVNHALISTLAWKTALNEVAFVDYHQFRAEVNVIATEAPSPTSGQGNAAAQPATAEAPTLPTPQPAAAEAATPAATATAEAAHPAAPVAAAPPAPPPPSPDELAAANREKLMQQLPVYKATARNVLVDVVVTRGNGEPVHGLTRQDFAIQEGGKPQSVDFFEEHAAKAPLEEKTQPPVSLPRDMYSNVPPAPVSDAVNVLLLDSLNTALQDQTRVHKQTLEFLKKMRPGTRVAVFTLGSSLRFVQGFTTDASVLQAALNDERNYKGPTKDAASRSRQDDADDAAEIASLRRAGTSEFAVQALQDAQASHANRQMFNQMDMTVEALTSIARYLAAVPGRKNLIWFANNFPLVIFQAPDSHSQDASRLEAYQGKLKATAALLTKANVAVYPVSAEGTMDDHYYQDTGVVDPSGGSPMSGGAHIGSNGTTNMGNFSGDAAARANTIYSMEQIAAETGGKAIFNTNDLNAAMQRAIDDGSNYYEMAYSPTDQKMDGSYRRIAVKLTHGNYKLAFRRGYYAVETIDIPVAAGSNPLRPLMKWGLPSSTQILYLVQAAPMVPQPPANVPRAGSNAALTGATTRYAVDFVIRATEVQWQTQPNGNHTGKIQVELLAYDRTGKALNWEGGTLAMDLNAGNYATIQRSGIPAHLEIDAPAMSDFYLETGVYDWSTGKAGTLEIPLNIANPTAAADRDNKSAAR